MNFGFEELRSFVWVEGEVFVDPDADGLSAGIEDGFGSARVSIDVDIHGAGSESVVVITEGDGTFGVQVPVPGDAVVDVLVHVEPSNFPGVVFTTPDSRLVTDVPAEGIVEGIGFGFRPERIPIIGDWDGDGVHTVGLYESSTAMFYLRNPNAAGPAELVFRFSEPNAIPRSG